MAYWHMQLHPNDIEWEREKELLEKISLIGLGLANEAETNKFISELKIDDMVLIKRGKVPIALVKVVGDLEDANENDLNNLDWFRYRRKIKVLDWAKDETGNFSSSGGSLQKLVNKQTKTYIYIDEWYRSLQNKFYTKQNGLKLRKIFIEDFKMFKNTTINLTYPKNIKGEALAIPIIVLAGINGTGKTTLLEYFSDFANYIYTKDEDKSFVDYERYDNEQKLYRQINHDTSYSITQNHLKAPSALASYFGKNILYIPINKDFEDVKKLIVKYLYKEVWVNGKLATAAYKQLKKYIDNIFKELNLFIEFDSISVDSKNEKVFFGNKNGDKFSIDEISTGEKTLLSKILYLYLNEIKNQVVLIDEPELSLHPAWQNKILKIYEDFAKVNNCQIIIATHSPHIIGSARNEYLRVLRFNDEGNVEMVSDLKSYGRDITWVLEEVMGTEYTREKAILDKIKAIEKLLDSKKYVTAGKKIATLESIIGTKDKEIVRLRTILDFERD